MYLHAWESGLKTTYYLRSRPAARIARATDATLPPEAGELPAGQPATDQAAAAAPLACSLENPETCALSMTAAELSPQRRMLLDPGLDLTLRPMRYPQFYDRFRDAIRNTWTVEEVDLHSDLGDLARLSPAERHLVSRLVAFFATGDTIVANNLVLNLYQHVNSPERRLYLSRQLFE